MKYSLLYIAPYLLLILAVYSCQKMPEYVIAEDKMEQLLIDIHLSEGYVDRVISRPTKDKKEEVRNTVFEKHGVTKEQFDTSLMWYGKNLEVYMNIYDQVIAAIKQQNNALKEEISRQNAQVLTAPGDSVNVWKGAPFYLFEPDISNRLLSFSIEGDVNFKNKDSFTFSAHLHTITAGVATSGISPIATLGVKYKDGVVVSVSKNVQPNGVFELSLSSEDKVIDRLFGSLYIPVDNKEYAMFTDSISVLRVHK